MIQRRAMPMLRKTVAAIGVAALCGTGASVALPAAAAGPDTPGAVQIAQCGAKKACNPCNPCNPCAVKKVKACNPCNPCNPCAAKNPCNPCNPCAAKKSN